MSNKLYVGNLPYQINESDLESAFAPFGEITDVALIKDRETGRLKGFGFVEYSSADAAKKALELDGQELSGRPMRVSIAREKQAGGGGRGGRSNRGGNREYNSGGNW